MASFPRWPAAYFQDRRVLPQDRFPFEVKQLIGVANDGQSIHLYDLSEDLEDEYFVLFFFPMDFKNDNSEVLEFARLLDKFHEQHCNVVGVTAESPYAIRHWIKKSKEKGGFGQALGFPILSDKDQSLASLLGVGRTCGMPARATFIVDWTGHIRYLSTQRSDIGRAVSEIFRLVKAFRYSDLHGRALPPAWQNEGDPFIPTEFNKKMKYYKQLAEKSSAPVEGESASVIAHNIRDQENSKKTEGQEAQASVNQDLPKDRQEYGAIGNPSREQPDSSKQNQNAQQAKQSFHSTGTEHDHQLSRSLNPTHVHDSPINNPPADSQEPNHENGQNDDHNDPNEQQPGHDHQSTEALSSMLQGHPKEVHGPGGAPTHRHTQQLDAEQKNQNSLGAMLNHNVHGQKPEGSKGHEATHHPKHDSMAGSLQENDQKPPSSLGSMPNHDSDPGQKPEGTQQLSKPGNLPSSDQNPHNRLGSIHDHNSDFGHKPHPTEAPEAGLQFEQDSKPKSLPTSEDGQHVSHDHNTEQNQLTGKENELNEKKDVLKGGPGTNVKSEGNQKKQASIEHQRIEKISDDKPEKSELKSSDAEQNNDANKEESTDIRLTRGAVLVRDEEDKSVKEGGSPAERAPTVVPDHTGEIPGALSVNPPNEKKKAEHEHVDMTDSQLNRAIFHIRSGTKKMEKIMKKSKLR